MNTSTAKTAANAELRAAAWCRREAAKSPIGSAARSAEVNEHRNRIREARWLRIYSQLRAA